jgi:acetolactate synthase small subunit
MLHTFVALVQNKPGVLTRVASLFRRLNINIVSLTVGESERTNQPPIMKRLQSIPQPTNNIA